VLGAAQPQLEDVGTATPGVSASPFPLPPSPPSRPLGRRGAPLILARGEVARATTMPIQEVAVGEVASRRPVRDIDPHTVESMALIHYCCGVGTHTRSRNRRRRRWSSEGGVDGQRATTMCVHR
jgi:hypothetical protein